MSALSSPFTAGFWYKNSLINSGSGKVELPLVENEPLGKSLGHVERCELRIEGMTCGACVEVSSLSFRLLLRSNLNKNPLFKSPSKECSDHNPESTL